MSVVKRQISLGSRRWEIEVDLDANQLQVWIDGIAHRYEIRRVAGSQIELVDPNHPHRPVTRGHCARAGDQLWVHTGRALRFTLERSDRRRAHAATESDSVQAPMTGTVRKVCVAPEEAVTRGQPLVILEAMKMEHVLRAPRDGVVAQVNTTEGTQAEAQSVLVRLRPLSS